MKAERPTLDSVQRAGSPSQISSALGMEARPGAERSGGSYYNEHDAYAAAWLRRLIAMGLIAPGVVDERSITEIKAHELTGYTQCHFFAGIGGWPLALRLAGWGDDEPAWTGSCPCQPFSDAGEGAGLADERHLWPTWFALVRECGPAILFGEQVATQAALAWLDVVFDDLEGADYACAAADLCAASVGAPQRRQRLWWMADANDSRRERAERQRQSHQAREKRATACRESLRSNRGPWPPGPRALDSIPLLANGLPGTMGGCKGYGNAIVPEVAAEFVMASIEAASSVRWAAGAGRGASQALAALGASTGNAESSDGGRKP